MLDLIQVMIHDGDNALSSVSQCEERVARTHSFQLYCVSYCGEGVVRAHSLQLYCVSYCGKNGN